MLILWTIFGAFEIVAQFLPDRSERARRRRLRKFSRFVNAMREQDIPR